MNSVLIVDDAAICREPIAAMLQAQGFDSQCAANCQDAFSILERRHPDAIVLDINMPDMDGLSFLRKLRARQAWKDIPVIVLTGTAVRETIVSAANLGVKEYMIKDSFSPRDLVARLQRQMPRAAAEAALMPQVEAGAKNPSLAAPVAQAADDRPLYLTRQQTIKRLAACSKMKAIPGVVLEVVALTSSPRCEMGDLVRLLKSDPILAARILHTANSAAFATRKVRVATIEEAARNIGVSRIRGIATAAGVIDALQADATDPVALMRCWQHALAVAGVLAALPPDPRAPAGIGYMLGLCHDLGDTILQQYFPREFAAMTQRHQATGKPLHQLKHEFLGVSNSEFNSLALAKLNLPRDIMAPISEFLERGSSAAGCTNLLVQRLGIANGYVHGLLLSHSPLAPIPAWSVTEMASALGTADPPKIDGQALRDEVVLTTNMLIKLPADRQSAGSEPLVPPQQVRIAYFRDPLLSGFDPIFAALRLLCDVTTLEELPDSPQALSGDAGLIVALGPQTDAGDIRKIADRWRSIPSNSVPLLCLANLSEAPGVPAAVTLGAYPTCAQALADFITTAGAPAS